MHGLETPASAWVRRFAPLIPPGGRVLDLACGGGRHARYLAARGHEVLAVDRDPACGAALAGLEGVEFRCLDLETDDWPLAGERFEAVVVTNYLWRPRLAGLADLLSPGGLLIYETFADGHAAFGKPSNPEFLLRPGELLRVFATLRILAFEDGEVARPARVQRVAALAWPEGEILPARLCRLDAGEGEPSASRE